MKPFSRVNIKVTQQYDFSLQISKNKSQTGKQTSKKCQCSGIVG